MPLLSIVVVLVVALVLLWAVQKLIVAFAITEPFATVIYVLLVVAILGVVLGQLGLLPNGRL